MPGLRFSASFPTWEADGKRRQPNESASVLADVSNRGHNSLAVFSVGGSTAALALELEQVIPADGDWPRNFSLDPTGRWLLVADQRSGSVVFARNRESGRLTPTHHRIAVPSPPLPALSSARRSDDLTEAS